MAVMRGCISKHGCRPRPPGALIETKALLCVLVRAPAGVSCRMSREIGSASLCLRLCTHVHQFVEMGSQTAM